MITRRVVGCVFNCSPGGTMLALGIVFLVGLLGTATAIEPLTVDIFYLGDCFAYAATPYTYLKEEPPFRMTAIPTWDLDLMRAMRHYMPRTYQNHVENHDVVLMSDAVRSLFEPKLLQWFGRGVREGGQGLLMVGGYGSFGARVGLPSWGGSPIEEVLPCSCLDQEAYEGDAPVFPVPVDDGHEFVKPISWKSSPPFLGFNTVVPKPGSTEILRPRVSVGRAEGPILVHWTIGEGASLAHTPDLTYGWVGLFADWDYYGDYCVNLIYLLSGIGVPQDISLVHAARIAMVSYAQERALLIGLAEFVDRFGADSKPIEEGLARIDEMKNEADLEYVGQDFLAALEKLDEVRREVRRLGERAIELKNRALLWVHLAEWLVVTATLMITGYVVWTLMVQRGLYKEVRSTRLA